MLRPQARGFSLRTSVPVVGGLKKKKPFLLWSGSDRDGNVFSAAESCAVGAFDLYDDGYRFAGRYIFGNDDIDLIEADALRLENRA